MQTKIDVPWKVEVPWIGNQTQAVYLAKKLFNCEMACETKNCSKCNCKADVIGTLRGRAHDLEKKYKKILRSVAPSIEKLQKIEKFDSAARAYNRGDGYCEIGLFGAAFIYDGLRFDYTEIRKRAYQLR